MLNSKDKLDALARIAEALREKAKILIGVADPENSANTNHNYLPPTVIYDLHNCSALQQDEILAPIVILNSVKYAHEAIKWANTTPYGLCASIWTQNFDMASKLAAKLDVGTTWINDWKPFEMTQANSGLKASGRSSRTGPSVFEFYQDRKEVILTGSTQP